MSYALCAILHWVDTEESVEKIQEFLNIQFGTNIIQPNIIQHRIFLIRPLIKLDDKKKDNVSSTSYNIVHYISLSPFREM